MFDSLDKAAHAALEIARLEPAACDLMDRRHLNLARETDVRYELLIPGEAEAMLLVEHHADNRDELAAETRRSRRAGPIQSRASPPPSHIAEDEADFQLYWGLAQRFVPTLYRMQGSTRPTPCIEDIAVPLEALARSSCGTCRTRSSGCKSRRRSSATPPTASSTSARSSTSPIPTTSARWKTLAAELYEKVWLLRGTISGEHGDGLSRTPFLARQYGPLVNVFRELKQIFDPQGLLNPGKMVPARADAHDAAPAPSGQSPVRGRDADQRLRRNRPPKTATRRDRSSCSSTGGLRKWPPPPALCNGCGACRSTSPDVRMCPIFRMNPREEASPRAKANLVRGLLDGNLPDDTLLQDVCKEVADLCVHCHMCRLECPANVDIPKLMLEAKAAYVAPTA